MAWLEYLLPLIFLFPLGATALIVIALRNLHDGRVRSPFDAGLLHEPGQAQRDRLDRAFASLFLNGALGPIVTLAPLVYGMGRMLFASRHSWLEWALYGALSTLLVLAFCLRLIRDFQQIRRIKLELASRLAVGQRLARQVRPAAPRCGLFHDLPRDRGRIDHVAVTPDGVFAVTTRGRERPALADGQPQGVVTVEAERLRFPGWSERRPLREARRAADWLAHWLAHELGRAVPVQGVLALPGWQVEAAEAAGDLLVVSGACLDQRLPRRQPDALDAATLEAVLAALTRRAQEGETPCPPTSPPA